MMLREIHTAAHTALLDLETGEGMLVRPLSAYDVTDPHPSTRVLIEPAGCFVATAADPTLHGSDLTAMLVLLDSHGWEVSEDEDGGPITNGYTQSGREIWGLYGREPIGSTDLDAMVAASAALLSQARLIR